MDATQKMIDSLLELEDDELTEWEASFVDSVYKQYAKNKQLTEKQMTILKTLYDREY